MPTTFPGLDTGQTLFAMADDAGHTAIDLVERSIMSESALDQGIYDGADSAWHTAGLPASTTGHLIRIYVGTASDKAGGVIVDGVWVIFKFDGTHEISDSVANFPLEDVALANFQTFFGNDGDESDQTIAAVTTPINVSVEQ